MIVRRRTARVRSDSRIPGPLAEELLMSRTRSLVLLLVVGLLAALVPAGAASAKAMTAKDRAAVRKQLRKQIKRNPRAIRSKRFLKRAALVNFRLPITIRLRGGNTPGTCNG